jgi:DNA invertase Pin-like site-specific DNA recombinase
MNSGKIQAVTYLRVSGESQVEGDGLIRQRAACEAYARKHGIEIVDEFRDEGVSGCREPQYRPGLQALIGRLAMNGVRMVLVEHPDRLGRDSEVGPAVRLALRKIGGLRVIRTDREIDILDESSRDLNTIDDLIADRARRLLVDRMAKARARRRDAGIRCDGRKPYGFRSGESAGLDRLIGLVRGERLSLRRVASILNSENVPTRSGRPWSAGSVASVVRSTTSPIAVTLSA